MACDVRRGTLAIWLALACAGCPSTTLWLDGAAHDAGTQAGAHADPTASDASGAMSVATATVPPPPAPAADGGSTAAPITPAADGGSAPAPPPPTRSGADADTDAGASNPSDADPQPTRLPSVSGSCPKLDANGRYSFRDSTGHSLSVQIYIAPDAKTKPAPGGPLVLYFHAIGATPSEVVQAFTQASIDSVVAQGGVVAAFESSVCVMCLLDDQQVIWYEQDAPVVDEVVACAREQAAIDPRRIHAIGFSAGGMYAMYLALARGAYLASVISYSGGLSDQQITPEDPTNHLAALLSYGRPDLDNAVVSFPAQSIAWYDQTHAQGSFSLLCDHGGGHMIPAELSPLAARFFADHPYRVNPEPYAARIPSDYPSYCADAPPNR